MFASSVSRVLTGVFLVSLLGIGVGCSPSYTKLETDTSRVVETGSGNAKVYRYQREQPVVEKTQVVEETVEEATKKPADAPESDNGGNGEGEGTPQTNGDSGSGS